MAASLNVFAVALHWLWHPAAPSHPSPQRGKSDRHQLRGKHYEIYLSDPRRTAPEKFKTVIRQPLT